ncbi:type IV pilus assembly protein PilA [Dyella japonica]|uniref:Type IV pilus assembly protein PilA n=2 Tax=Dyella japonica TaxID=231455 RepID=A0ABV2K035_9GAMM
MRGERSRPVMIGLALLAIVAVVATIAIPTWRNHRVAEHLDEALQSGEAAKLVVMEAATVRGGLSQLKPGDLTFNAASSLNAYVSKIDVSESGRVTIATRNTGAAPDPVFLLTPLDNSATGGNAPLIWSCDIIAGNTQRMPTRCVRPALPAPATTIKG